MRHNLKITSLLVYTIFLCCFLLASCSSDTGSSLPSKGSSDNTTSQTVKKPTIDLDVIASYPEINLKYVPTSKGELTEESENGVFDYSSSSDGYFMAKYTGESTGDEADIVVLVMTPNPEHPQYQYNIPQDGQYYPFPFSEGNGRYTIGLYKRIQGLEYAQLMGMECEVSISDDLLPFLITNHKVRYSGKSLSVKLASELVKDNNEFFSQVSEVYNYVIANVSYDTKKATAAANGEIPLYIPDNDQILLSKEGICFDYATLTTAMLRSLEIPTKVVFGWASTGSGTDPVYHAWISVYSDETGWVDGIIEFSSDGWTRMDPTFSASSNNKSMANFIGDGGNYTDHLHF